MGYMGLCLHRALKGSVLLTDKLSIGAGVVVPALLTAAGQPMTDAVASYVAWAIIIAVGSGIFLRLATAPFFIWKEDQSRIAKLKREIADNGKSRRSIMDERFAPKRADLVEMIHNLKSGYNLTNESRKKFEKEVARFERAANLFYHDDRIKRLSQKYRMVVIAHAHAMACLFSCQARALFLDHKIDLDEQGRMHGELSPIKAHMQAVSEHLTALLMMDEEFANLTADRVSSTKTAYVFGSIQTHDLGNGCLWVETMFLDGMTIPKQPPSAEAVERYAEIMDDFNPM